MPSPEQVNLYQPALLWAADGTYDDRGNPRVATSPQEIRVRYDNKASEAIDPNGNTIKVDATATVKQDIRIGSLMVSSTLANWVGTGSGLVDQHMMQVVTFDKTPDIRNRFQMRTIGLMKFHNK